MRRHDGFSMVEVLVSIVILSIGLLGAAGLLSASLRSTNTAYYRSQATVLADDILDRMRANVTAARAGHYNADFGPSFPAPSGSLARFDTEEWAAVLATELPAGEGRVTVNGSAATGHVVEVTIQWGDDDGDPNVFVTRTSL